MCTEKYLQAKIVKALKNAGFFVRKVSAENHRGLPDLLIIGHGVTALAEIKTPTGRLSKFQQHTLQEIIHAGGEVYVWRDLDDVSEFIQEARSRN
jgi:Holliday junction resolvase